MQQFILGHASDTDWHSALEQALQFTSAPDATPNFGFLYINEGFADDLGDILRELKLRTGIAHWVGSVGEAILCTRNEYYEQAALAILLCEFPADSFEVFDLKNFDPGTTPADPMGGLRVAMVHGDPRNATLADTIDDFPQQLGNGYLCGGLTSAESHFYQIADDITEGTLSGVIFNDEVEMVSGLSQGCSPIGPLHTLTDCDYHMAISIDNRPAMEVFKEDIGEVLARDIDRAAGYIFAGFPVAGSDTGDYLVRNIVGIDPEHGRIAVGDHMTEGVPIMFCRRDGKTASEDMRRMLDDIKRRLNGRTARGGIYISCLGRGRHLFGPGAGEMNLIADALGDIPLVGFYANGEIAGHRLYGYTGVLTLFV